MVLHGCKKDWDKIKPSEPATVKEHVSFRFCGS